MHRPRLTGLQRPRLLWVSVLAVALGLVAMHHMSRNHVAAEPFSGGHSHVTSEPAGDHRALAAPLGTADHPHLQPTGSTSHHTSEAGETCPGCAAHQVALACLAALTLLAVSALSRSPLLGPGFLVRPVFRAALGRRGTWRARPPLTVMEISVSRT